MGCNRRGNAVCPVCGERFGYPFDGVSLHADKRTRGRDFCPCRPGAKPLYEVAGSEDGETGVESLCKKAYWTILAFILVFGGLIGIVILILFVISKILS